MKSKLMKWAAAGVLAGAPAIGLARVHHVSAAPLMAVSSSIANVPAAKKLAAVKHTAVAHKATAKVLHKTRKVVKHTAKPKIKHKIAPKVIAKH